MRTRLLAVAMTVCIPAVSFAQRGGGTKPGADDPAIQADMLATLGRDTALVVQALDHLARLAGKPLASLDEARRDAVAQEFRASGGAAAATLVRVGGQTLLFDTGRAVCMRMAAVGALPVIVLALPAGHLADNLNRRWLTIITLPSL